MKGRDGFWMPREVRAYCAGFLDADGSVQISKQRDTYGLNHYKSRAVLYNTNRNVCEFIQRFYGGSISAADRRYQKTMYQLTLTTRQAYLFCQSIVEFAIIKKIRLENVIKFYEYQKEVGRIRATPGSKRLALNSQDLESYEQYYLMAKHLNKRGEGKIP